MGAIGSSRSRGSTASSSSPVTDASLSRLSAAIVTPTTSLVARRELAGTRAQAAARAEMWAARTRSRMISSRRKLSPMKSCRLRASMSFFLGMSAVCGIGRPIGCRNSAVTANQSAIAPTIDASAPALTNPQAPSLPRVRT